MTDSDTPTTLSMAVCLFPEVTQLDFVGAVELLGFLSPKNRAISKSLGGIESPYMIATAYLSHTLDPVEPNTGPLLLPSGSYKDTTKQFDILLIPGGPGALPENVDASLLEFLRRQAPGAKYILSVCSGSWILAVAGILDGKCATTNKATFRQVVAATKDIPVTWIPKARWVVDEEKRVWTSSGVTAGMHMANAFLEHLVGKQTAAVVRSIVELAPSEQDDDEFAAIHGLV